MELIYPSIEVLTDVNADQMFKRIERAGRTCYKSECKITENSSKEFVKNILGRNHESVIEHESISVKFVCDRGVSHELVRHRLMSFSQESTRYVNYNKRGMTFVIPPWVNIKPCQLTIDPSTLGLDTLVSDEITKSWLNTMMECERQYNKSCSFGAKPEQARSLLPNSLKTEIVVTGNLRNWRHVLNLRTAKAAHPQMREVMIKVYDEFIKLGLEPIFKDIQPYRE